MLFLYSLIFLSISCFRDNMKSSQAKSSNSENLKNYEFKNESIKNYDKIKLRGLQEKKPIRIYVDKVYMKKYFQIVDRSAIEIFDYSIDKVKNTLEKLIKVEQETEEIDISAKIQEFVDADFSMDIFDQELLNGKKINKDLVIFVKPATKNEVGKCNENYKIVKQNSKGRPIIAYVLIDISLLSSVEEAEENSNEYKKEFLSYVLLHQFTHILGFTRSIVNDNRNNILIKSKTVNRINSLNLEKNVEKEIIKGNKLMEEAKKYFNCKDSNILDGIELEEIIEKDCLEYIHWESRILLGDYMTAFLYAQEQVISNLTLALHLKMNFALVVQRQHAVLEDSVEVFAIIKNLLH